MDLRKRIFRMNVFTHNFNPNSNSGPNKFTRSLFLKLLEEKEIYVTSQEEADIEFLSHTTDCSKEKAYGFETRWNLF